MDIGNIHSLSFSECNVEVVQALLLFLNKTNLLIKKTAYLTKSYLKHSLTKNILKT